MQALRVSIFICAVCGLLSSCWMAGPYINWAQNETHKEVNLDDTNAFLQAANDLWKKGEEYNLSGELVIMKDGEVLLDKATGLDNPDTPVLVGSLSKQFTGALILELVEQGKVNLDDYVCDYINYYCEGDLKSITVRHLMSHTSGLPPSANQTFMEFVLSEFLVSRSTEEQMRPVNMTLLSPVGKEFNYSNLGFVILSRIIEIKTQQGFAAAMNDFFKRHGLTKTFVKDHASVAQLKSSYNVRLYGGPRIIQVPIPSNIIPYENFVGAGGVVSTARDMAKWFHQQWKAHGFDYWLKDIAHDKKQQPISKEAPIYYFGGLMADPSSGFLFHNGSVLGYRAEGILNSKTGTVAFVILNSSTMSGDEAKIVDAWESLFTGQEYDVPKSQL